MTLTGLSRPAELRLKAMPSTEWNPTAYLTFASERTQPFIDLLSRVRTPGVRSIVDLGCGPGNGMPVVRAMWPQAHVTGVDSSAEMIARAREATADDPYVTYHQADVRSLSPADLPEGRAADLVVSNAALQWLPDHRELLPQLMDLVAPGGAFAVQVPGNFGAPSHRLLGELVEQEPYAAHLDPEVLLRPTAGIQDYMHDVARPGWEVEAWETTYQHILQGDDPVFEWISAAAARPVLQSLPDRERQFALQYKSALREAYPRTGLGTVLPFRRIFFIARHSAA